MKKLKIYLDTSVINFLFAEDAPEFQQITLEFFDKYINDYDYIFVHSREVEEIERFKSEFGATTLLITANIKSNETKYISDQINNIDYDNVIAIEKMSESTSQLSIDRTVYQAIDPYDYKLSIDKVENGLKMEKFLCLSRIVSR